MELGRRAGRPVAGVTVSAVAVASGTRSSLGEDPSEVEDSASGTGAVVGDRSPMGSRSEESPAAEPSSLRIFSLYSR